MSRAGRATQRGGSNTGGGRRMQRRAVLVAVGLGVTGCVGGQDDDPVDAAGNGTGNQSQATANDTNETDEDTEDDSDDQEVSIDTRQGWPMFQYDAANTGYNPEADGPEGEVHEVWQADTGAFTGDDDDRPLTPSSPIVADNVVYVRDLNEDIVAIHAADGTEKWRTAIPHSNPNDLTFSAPAVMDGGVYVTSTNGHVYRLDAETGEKQWETYAEGIVSSSPTVVDGTVYVSSGRYLFALDAADGSE